MNIIFVSSLGNLVELSLLFFCNIPYFLKVKSKIVLCCVEAYTSVLFMLKVLTYTLVSIFFSPQYMHLPRFLLSLGIFLYANIQKYKQQYHRTIRTQKRFTTLQRRYHGVQDVMTTPQPLTFRTRNYTKITYKTTINIQALITKNY